MGSSSYVVAQNSCSSEREHTHRTSTTQAPREAVGAPATPPPTHTHLASITQVLVKTRGVAHPSAKRRPPPLGKQHTDSEVVTNHDAAQGHAAGVLRWQHAAGARAPSTYRDSRCRLAPRPCRHDGGAERALLQVVLLQALVRLVVVLYITQEYARKHTVTQSWYTRTRPFPLPTRFLSLRNKHLPQIQCRHLLRPMRRTQLLRMREHGGRYTLAGSYVHHGLLHDGCHSQATSIVPLPPPPDSHRQRRLTGATRCFCLCTPSSYRVSNTLPP